MADLMQVSLIIVNSQIKITYFKRVSVQRWRGDNTDHGQVFLRLVELLGKPFQKNSFDFSDKKYFEDLFKFGAEISVMKEFRESKKARGVKDARYINRTYYGLYNILHVLKANVETSRFPGQV